MELGQQSHEATCNHTMFLKAGLQLHYDTIKKRDEYGPPK
jgi:hypothetical protein